MTLQIEEGKFYRDRSGSVCGPARLSEEDGSDPWRLFDGSEVNTYTPEGYFWTDGPGSQWDLVEEVPDPNAKPAAGCPAAQVDAQRDEYGPDPRAKQQAALAALAAYDDAAYGGPIPAPDLVDHPPHYTAGGIECFDAMAAMLSKEELIGYLRGNSFKYRWRFRHKGGAEDLRKAEWYEKKLLDLVA